MNSIRTFRYVAVIEATSFLLLLVASAIKNTGGSALGVHILGPIHGVLFLTYLYLAFSLRLEAGWSARTTALIVIGAIVPFGGYFVDRWLAKNASPTTT
jgi:integral membrane protein